MTRLARMEGMLSPDPIKYGVELPPLGSTIALARQRADGKSSLRQRVVRCVRRETRLPEG